MTMLDTIQTLSAGPLGWAGLFGALGFAIKQTASALKTRSEAKSKRIVAEAEAERVRAEAKAAADLEAARTERVEAEHEVQVTTITAEMLARYEARLTQAEKDARAARAAVAACEERHRRAQEQHAEALAVRDKRIAALERAVRRLGDTPTGMQAVDGREKP